MHVHEPTTNAARCLQAPAAFRKHVGRALVSNSARKIVGAIDLAGRAGLSVVLLPIGVERSSGPPAPEPCMILNKRSLRVRQPGDICCPGGGIEPRVDHLLARLLRLPGTPLKRWKHYSQWRRERPDELHQLRLLLATALREGLEEMRLNPLAVDFLGRLPCEPLVMFRRVIQPLVVWVNRQRRFYPNWEVERVVRIPLRRFLDPAHYICYRLTMPDPRASVTAGGRLDFPAFRFETPQGTEILWGATYRIAMAFLNLVFDFAPPGLQTLEVVTRRLPPQYMTGAE